MNPTQRCVQAGVAVLALAGLAPVCAQPAASGVAGIHTCVDAQGHRLTSDRPIAECVGREQRLLNPDGSLKRVIPPTLTAEEWAEREAAERRAELARAALADAVLRDRNLMARYPNEAKHRKARETALDTVRLAMKATEQRLKELAAERVPLLDEAEFYKGRQMPQRLKQQLDANDAGVDAQRHSATNQQAELDRINAIYDLELDRLRRLWAGAPRGSMGPVPVVPSSSTHTAPTGLRSASP